MSLYFLSKGGYFYRDNSSGYTPSKYEAGIYDRKTALRRERSCEEVRAIPVTEKVKLDELELVIKKLQKIRECLILNDEAVEKAGKE